ncbi:hypothetical protein J1N35_008188 [Gossypium stocksii]|uniref:Uncharacterized protein n=1 Tax=Gossypium stocksii TaxID=47602 RepID=A0A9D4AG99_9ROSI|nr:hypothetical protein J1N35_008188 [Gossypium stocksii]
MDQCITENQLELNLKNQQEFGFEDEIELHRTEEIFDLINMEIDVELEVEELQPIMNESVKESIHFLAITDEVPTKEMDEFISFSFDEEDKAWVDRTSYDMEAKWLKVIIPRRQCRVGSDLAPSGS